MAPPTTLRCRAAVALAAVLLGCACAAPPVLAQSGTGLYEPFPEAAVKKRAQRYVERLGDRTAGVEARVSDAELARGVFVRPDPSGAALPPPATSAGSGQATARSGGDEVGLAMPLQLLLLLAVLLLPAVALTRGRRTHAA
jgi:hypothetical protein